MLQLPAVIHAAEETMIIHPGEMWFPPIVFGIITVVLLLALVLVTFSFRNMAAQHPKNPTIYVYEPIGHPGHPVEGASHQGAETHPGHETSIGGHHASTPAVAAGDDKH